MYLNALSGFFSCEGRVNRRQYLLVLVLWAIVVSCISVPFLDNPSALQALHFFLALFLLPTQIKRLHDMNMSGWVVLLVIIPLVGFILGLGLLIGSGTKGPNKFGTEPHLTDK